MGNSLGVTWETSGNIHKICLLPQSVPGTASWAREGEGRKIHEKFRLEGRVNIVVAAAVVAGGTPEAKARPGPGWKKKKKYPKIPHTASFAKPKLGCGTRWQFFPPQHSLSSPHQKPENLKSWICPLVLQISIFFYAFPTSSPTKPKQPLRPPTTENPSVVAIKSPRSNLNS